MFYDKLGRMLQRLFRECLVQYSSFPRMSLGINGHNGVWLNRSLPDFIRSGSPDIGFRPVYIFMRPWRDEQDFIGMDTDFVA